MRRSVLIYTTRKRKGDPSVRVPADEVYKAWRDIDAQEPDSESLSLEESDQLRDPEFVSWDQESKPYGV